MRPNIATAPPVAHLVGPGKLKISNSRLIFAQPEKSPLTLDLESLQTLLCYGSISLSDEALSQLLHHNVSVVLLTPMGAKCLGRLVPNDDSTLLIRLGQMRCLTDPREQFEFARTIVLAKLESQHEAIRHFHRHQVPTAKSAAQKLDDLRQAAAKANSLDSVRGYEGQGSAIWFELFGQLVKPPWSFTTRNRQPPRDPVNSLLSLSAVWLTNRVIARIQARGLETCLGALHVYRAGRPSLACDLIEPLRAVAVERWTIQFCNQGKQHPSQFSQDPTHGCRLPEGSFGSTLADWEQWCHLAKIWEQVDEHLDRVCRHFRQFAQLPTP